MKFPSRRKPLALILCCSFAGTVAVGALDPAHAQTVAPLRVDPRLLGLPPAKPVAASPSAPVDIPVAQTAPIDTPSVETRAVSNSTAEARNDAVKENAPPTSPSAPRAASSASRAGKDAKP
jgi:LPS-assembly protein